MLFIRNRLWLAVAICLGMSGAAVLGQTLGQAPPPSASIEAIFGLMPPPRIGGATREAVTDYEKTQAGLGYSVRYRLPGWTTDVYFYDMRRPAIPEDPTSAVVQGERDRARGDVFAMVQRGVYRDVTAGDDYTIGDAAGTPRFTCSRLRYFHVPQDIELDSRLCVGGWRGKFVKFRMSAPAGRADASEARRFIEAWIPVLWPQS